MKVRVFITNNRSTLVRGTAILRPIIGIVLHGITRNAYIVPIPLLYGAFVIA
jgi:hypothetical protein